MKKLMVLLMTFLFSISLVFTQNEVKVKVLTEAEEKIKEEIKETEEELEHSKEELKAVMQARKRLEGSNVSNRVKENFNDDFGNKADVVWTRGEFYDVAKFTEDGYAKKAYYDFDAQLIGVTWFVTFADMPERAKEKINEKYGDYEIGEVLFYDDNEKVDVDFFIYDSQFKHEDNYFVDVKNESQHIILRIDSEGGVHFFKEFK